MTFQACATADVTGAALGFVVLWQAFVQFNWLVLLRVCVSAHGLKYCWGLLFVRSYWQPSHLEGMVLFVPLTGNVFLIVKCSSGKFSVKINKKCSNVHILMFEGLWNITIKLAFNVVTAVSGAAPHFTSLRL